jgi:hypothetical protein
MAVKLSIGLQKKIGLPNYGSLAASCYVEFEIDRALIETDSVGFQEKVRGTFAVCQQAVTEQLARQQANESRSCNGHGNANGRRHEQRSSGSANGHHAGRPATASQARAIRAIAKRQQFEVARQSLWRPAPGGSERHGCEHADRRVKNAREWQRR